MSVVNRKKKENGTVKFISYDGKYPNLCHGVLTVEINGKIVKFGHHYSNYRYDEKTGKYYFTDEDVYNPNYNSFWRSTGGISHDGHWGDIEVHNGEWEINCDELPFEFWDYADELDEVINENIEQGCCGGCV